MVPSHLTSVFKRCVPKTEVEVTSPDDVMEGLGQVAFRACGFQRKASYLEAVASTLTLWSVLPDDALWSWKRASGS